MKIGHRKETRAEANWFDAKKYFSWRFDGDSKGRYLILWGGDACQRIVGIGVSTIHTGKESLDVIDIDGVPTTVLRCTERYEKAICACFDINSAYSFISHRLAECDIRWIFPELWIAWKNAKAKKDRRRAEHDIRAAKKNGTFVKKTKDERTIHGLSMYSLKSAARHYGVL